MDITRIAPFQIKALVQRDAPTTEGCGTDEDKPRRRTLVVASTDVIDRAGDIVEQDWRLEEYRQNPVILWAHDSGSPPVGKATEISVNGGVLLAEIEWDEGGERGAEVARQYRDGFLSAVSVGFVPGAMQPRYMLADDDPRKAESGYVLSKNTLLEISAVPVPANAQALALRGLAAPSESISALRSVLAQATADRLICAAKIEEIEARIGRKIASYEVTSGAVLAEAIDEGIRRALQSPDVQSQIQAIADQGPPEVEDEDWLDDEPAKTDPAQSETGDFWDE